MVGTGQRGHEGLAGRRLQSLELWHSPTAARRRAATSRAPGVDCDS